MSPLAPSRVRLAAILAGAVATAGCKKSEEIPAVPVESVTPAPIPFERPLTEEDHAEFGRSLEAAAAAGELTAINQLLRVKEVAVRANRGLNMSLSPAFQRALDTAAARGGGELAQGILSTVQGGGSYSFLRVRQVDGRQRVLMRMIMPAGPVTYQEISLTRYPDGQVGAEDVYSFTTGETVSNQCRRFAVAFIAEADPK